MKVTVDMELALLGCKTKIEETSYQMMQELDNLYPVESIQVYEKISALNKELICAKREYDRLCALEEKE